MLLFWFCMKKLADQNMKTYCEHQLTQFNLHYSNAVAVVNDTESTMIAAGRLIVSNSVAQGGRTKWGASTV